VPAPPHQRLRALPSISPGGRKALNATTPPAGPRPAKATAAEGHLFCERCGSLAPLGGPLGVSFCMACRRYLCAVCAPPGELRCGACRQSGSWDPQGIRAARDALGALREVERDLLALAEAHERRTAHGASASVDSGSSGAAQRLEELETKQRAAEATVEHVLRGPQLRDSPRANAIRSQLTASLAGVELAAARVREYEEVGAAPWTAISPFSSRRPSRNAVIAALWMIAGALALAAVVLWLGGALVPPRVGGDPSAPAIAESSTPAAARGAVAGATPAPRQHEAWSFDQLRMGSSLPGGFALRADDGSFAVAAFPNSVDRSLRLRATTSPTTLCHRLSGMPSRLAVRVRLEGTPRGGSELVDVTRADGSRLIGAVLTDAGVLEVQGGARQTVPIGSPNGGRWYDIRLGIERTGIADLVVDQVGGSELGRATVQLDDQADPEEVCFRLPPGDPPAELYLDDLRITY